MFRQSLVAARMSQRRRNPAASPRAAGDEPRGADHHDDTENVVSALRHAPPQRQIELGPIIRSKIQAPVLRASTLTRPRLVEQLGAAVRSRLTLLIAEAGYGKTTLLADFAARSGLRTMWYRLDPTDADVVTWTNHVVAAAREVEPGFGQATLSLMSQLATGGPPKSAFVASVIGELGDLEATPTVLVLDDFHAVDESADAAEFVMRLTRDAPPWLNIVISSRRRPPLELGRLTATGELAEIGTDELRFSRDEVVQLFAECYGMPLDADVLRDLDQRTKGWVASLQLFHGSVRGRPPSAIRALARALSGATSPIYDFLAEEVLANLPHELEQFLVRSSILERISAGPVVALFADAAQPPSVEIAREWIEEADRLTLLSRSSQSSDARQLHPLMRDFLVRHLRGTESDLAIREMHLRVARSVAEHDPLTAAHHFLEAGDEVEAMRCLGASVMLTMGSGQWGVASDLIERIKGVPADPAVAAIRARRLTEEGSLQEAAAVLDEVDVSASAADVRAVFRHARLSLGWRTGDRELMFSTLAEIQGDDETPPILRDIFQIFVDASPLATTPVPYATLAKRMERMALAQRDAGHLYYAAISLHNSAIAAVAAGRMRDAVRLGEEALAAFDNLSFAASERYSTYAVLSNCFFELGDRASAERYMALGVVSGDEHGDVHAEFALLLALTGARDRAERMLTSADALERSGLSDLQAETTSTFARALLLMNSDPHAAIELLSRLPRERPLDVGDTLAREALEALAHLLAGDAATAIGISTAAVEIARSREAHSAETRLEIVRTIALQDHDRLARAIDNAAAVGDLALLQNAEAIAPTLQMLQPVPTAILTSIERWPERWLPALRRQLDKGGSPEGRAAAELLDRYGDAADVIRLRAYARTYGGRHGTRSSLGRALSRRVAPKLEIQDLGPVRLKVGDREIFLSRTRRKPASMLMFLVTRPNLTATREQVLDQLWPDADPISASNSLNQSLYFLRRDIDPWYEDDVSVDYVRLRGDLVWIDGELASVASSRFLDSVREARSATTDGALALDIMSRYSGQFAPEFEYEEWAIAYRSRVHAAFLAFANASIDGLLGAGHHEAGRDAALKGIEIAPDADDIERRLIRAYWLLGARSAAAAQHQHLVARDRADGLEPPTLDELVHPPPSS